jgi:hypothetical protein
MKKEKVQLIDKLISILDKPDKELDELGAEEPLSPDYQKDLENWHQENLFGN